MLGNHWPRRIFKLLIWNYQFSSSYTRLIEEEPLKPQRQDGTCNGPWSHDCPASEPARGLLSLPGVREKWASGVSRCPKQRWIWSWPLKIEEEFILRARMAGTATFRGTSTRRGRSMQGPGGGGRSRTQGFAASRGGGEGIHCLGHSF